METVMSYLNGRWGIAKVTDADNGEVFELRHEKPALVGRNGYMWSTEYLNEEQLRDALVAGGATPSDVARVFAEARANSPTRERNVEPLGNSSWSCNRSTSQ